MHTSKPLIDVTRTLANVPPRTYNDGALKDGRQRNEEIEGGKFGDMKKMMKSSQAPSFRRIPRDELDEEFDIDFDLLGDESSHEDGAGHAEHHDVILDNEEPREHDAPVSNPVEDKRESKRRQRPAEGGVVRAQEPLPTMSDQNEQRRVGPRQSPSSASLRRTSGRNQRDAVATMDLRTTHIDESLVRSKENPFHRPTKSTAVALNRYSSTGGASLAGSDKSTRSSPIDAALVVKSVMNNNRFNGDSVCDHGRLALAERGKVSPELDLRQEDDPVPCVEAKGRFQHHTKAHPDEKLAVPGSSSLIGTDMQRRSRGLQDGGDDDDFVEEPRPSAGERHSIQPFQKPQEIRPIEKLSINRMSENNMTTSSRLALTERVGGSALSYFECTTTESKPKTNAMAVNCQVRADATICAGAGEGSGIIDRENVTKLEDRNHTRPEMLMTNKPETAGKSDNNLFHDRLRDFYGRSNAKWEDAPPLGTLHRFMNHDGLNRRQTNGMCDNHGLQSTSLADYRQRSHDGNDGLDPVSAIAPERNFNDYDGCASQLTLNAPLGAQSQPWWTRFPDFVPVAILDATGKNPRDGSTVHISYGLQFTDKKGARRSTTKVRGSASTEYKENIVDVLHGDGNFSFLSGNFPRDNTGFHSTLTLTATTSNAISTVQPLSGGDEASKTDLSRRQPGLCSRWLTLHGQKTFVDKYGNHLVGRAAYRASIAENKGTSGNTKAKQINGKRRGKGGRRARSRASRKSQEKT